MIYKIRLSIKTILLSLLFGILFGVIYYLSIQLFNTNYGISNDLFNPMGVLILLATIMAYRCNNIKTLLILEFLFILMLYFSAIILLDYKDVLKGIYSIGFGQFILVNILIGTVIGIVFSLFGLCFRLIKVNNLFYLLPLLLLIIDIINNINNIDDHLYLGIILFIDIVVFTIFIYMFRGKIRKIFKKKK